MQNAYSIIKSLTYLIGYSLDSKRYTLLKFGTKRSLLRIRRSVDIII
jgi:hypothetical protein